MDLHGYPGLFRELVHPPPWMEITQEDVDDTAPPERDRELRPLYLHANEGSARDLIRRFREHLHDKAVTRKWLGLRRRNHLVDSFAVEQFRDLVALARCLGKTNFESLYKAVFDFDEMSPAAGAPDLFVWDPAKIGHWFFAEVKGPHDHLRRSQAEWVRTSWEQIKGRFVLLVVPPPSELAGS
jgi:hypothetical protein